MGTKRKSHMQSTTLLNFKETKELILENYVKQTVEQKRKKSEHIEFMPLTAF
jgi:hypothetical protein